MNQRQGKILESVIREYQKTGQPVASQILVKKYNFDLSPATIRSEMMSLEEAGLLEQPHCSAGRVPTTKAYRLFVNEFLEKDLPSKEQRRIIDNLPELNQADIVSQRLARILADFSKNLGLSGSFGEIMDFHEFGFSSLFKDSELGQPERMKNILRGFDTLENEFTDLFEKLNKEVEVFIGEENPIEDFRECSLIVSGYKSDNNEGFIGVLGPKRMDYGKNIFLVEEIKKIIENN
ncbi:MAG: hypothetical protein HY764_01620 [Candidatus Portnoybacteria bacterium]|nr:hypothetical protein [Candidatus Portnoybacteria bacterium]